MARVAVVDDSRLARIFAEAALRKSGYDVVLVDPSSMQTTLEALLEAKPDLLILDHSMPAFQGPSLVRTCFEHPVLSQIKVLILTALHDEAMAERMKKLGVGEILHKPISHEELVNAVNKMLKGPAEL